MPDSLEDFWGRFNGALDSRPVADTACGCALSAAPESIDATLAVSRMLAQYTALAAQGTALQKIGVGKIEVPCEVWTAYANARQDYLIKAQEIFDQLAAKGITIEQVLYSGQGVFKIDASNPAHAATARLLAPLRPPAFVGLAKQCPQVVDMAGVQFTGLGWERTPIQLASVPLSAIQGLRVGSSVLTLIDDTANVVGFAAPSISQARKEIALLPRAFTTSDLKTVAAFTTCFQARGATPKASQRCAPASGLARARSLRWWGLFGIGVVAAFMVGGLIERVLRRPTLAGPEHSNPGDPIFLGDLYWKPRGLARRRRGI